LGAAIADADLAGFLAPDLFRRLCDVMEFNRHLTHDTTEVVQVKDASYLRTTKVTSPAATHPALAIVVHLPSGDRRKPETLDVSKFICVVKNSESTSSLQN